jgi:hypothetical protein
MATAADVFDICELHEAIVLQLPFFDILRVKAVSRTWNALIATSVAIKKRLFLVADGSCMRLDTEASTEEFETNGLGPPILQDMRYAVLPLFSRRKTTAGKGPAYHTAYLDDKKEQSCHFLLGGHKEPHTLAEDTTSSMFVTQPPCAALVLLVSGMRGPPGYVVTAVVRDENGIKLGLVREVFRKILEGRTQDGETSRGLGLGFYLGMIAKDCHLVQGVDDDDPFREEEDKHEIE